jgi:outer membrane lipoprotein-sorting protein
MHAAPRTVYLFCLWLVLGLSTPLGVSVAPAEELAASGDKAFTEAEQKILADIRSYLDGLNGASGRFLQISPQGDTSTGAFVMLRPGYIRFDYAPPSQLTVVSNGKTLAVQEDAKSDVDRYPVKATPLPLFWGEQPALAATQYVEAIFRSPGIVEIILRDPEGDTPGQLTLGFDYPRPKLRSWRVVDAQGQVVTILLRDVLARNDLDASLFILKSRRTGPSGKRK